MPLPKILYMKLPQVKKVIGTVTRGVWLGQSFTHALCKIVINAILKWKWHFKLESSLSE